MTKWKIYNEDIVEWSKNYTKTKFHALLCDPPYHLESITKRFGKNDSAPAKHGTDGAFERASKGFMGQTWDGGDVAFDPETWKAVGNVLMDGAFGMAFSASRNWYRLAVAIEDAGFIIHPTIFLWGYGQGFPKATNIAKQIEKWYYGSDEQRTETLPKYCLRCMWEADISQTESPESSNRKALQSSLQKQGIYTKGKEGLAKVHLSKRKEKSGVDGRNDIQTSQGKLLRSEICEMPNQVPTYGESRWIHNGASSSYGEAFEKITKQNGSSSSYRPQSFKQFHKELDALCKQHRTQAIRELSEIWLGHRYGLQALKPAVEPIIVFQKPFNGKPIDNITQTGAGALNIDGGRIPLENGEEYTINTFDDGAKPFGNGAGHKFTSKKVENLGRNLYQTQSWKNTSTDGVGSVNDDWKNGRWPANFILDEVAAEHLDNQTGTLKSGKMLSTSHRSTDGSPNGIYGKFDVDAPLQETIGDSGGASRFFYTVSDKLDESDPVYYCSKVSQKERNAGLDDRNIHPTLKPIDLCKYLATLLLPPDAYAPRKILVPFSGVASEMIGCGLAGWEQVCGVEFDTDNGYIDIAEKRLGHWLNDKSK